MEPQSDSWSQKSATDQIIYGGKVAGGITGIGAFIFGLYTLVVAPLLSQDNLSTTFKKSEFRIPERFETEFTPRYTPIDKVGKNDESKPVADETGSVIAPRDKDLVEQFKYSGLEQFETYCFIEITNQSERPISGLDILFETEMLIEIEKEDGTRKVTLEKERFEIGKLRVDETVVVRTWSRTLPFDGISCVYDGGRHQLLMPTFDLFRSLKTSFFWALGILGFAFMLAATLEKIGRILKEDDEDIEDGDCTPPKAERLSIND